MYAVKVNGAWRTVNSPQDIEADETYSLTAPKKTSVEIAAEAASDAAKAELATIDLGSIRAIREYIAAKPDAPQILKDYDAKAAAERIKLK